MCSMRATLDAHRDERLRRRGARPRSRCGRQAEVVLFVKACMTRCGSSTFGMHDRCAATACSRGLALAPTGARRGTDRRVVLTPGWGDGPRGFEPCRDRQITHHWADEARSICRAWHV